MAELVPDIHKEFIEQSKHGDGRAQLQLYKLYAKAMYNVCMRIVCNEEEAKDVLQEAFVEAFRNLNSFRYESTFGAWLKRIVVNRSLNALRKNRFSLVYQDNLPDDIEVQEDVSGEDTVKYSVEKVHKAMIMLPEGARVVFSLYLMEGYDHTEISQILGISESTSKSQYIRAKQLIGNIVKNLN